MKSINLAVSIGDSSGIAPEILAQQIMMGCGDLPVELTVFAPESVMKSAFRTITPSLRIDGNQILGGKIPGSLVGIDDDVEWTPGHSTDSASMAAWHALDAAINSVISGTCAALVTLPIHKANMRKIGFPFDGHTDYLASRTNTAYPVMCYDAPDLKVALVTTHIGLKQVFQILSTSLIQHTTQLLHDYLERVGFTEPRLAIAGLNPHAGSGDCFGDEERGIIEPAIKWLRDTGIDASGPFAPDTVFLRARRGEFDAVVSMYHDQGSIAIKTLDFENTVNVTLGLPIIRTSVDHGTAYEIAGQGRASHHNLDAAIRLAAKLARILES